MRHHPPREHRSGTSPAPLWGRRLSRRHVIAGLGAGTAAVLLGACSPSTSRTSGPDGAAADELAFAEPDMLVSRDGLLEVTLRAAATLVTTGTENRYAYTYNQTTPGPTLRVRPGDRLIINLENELDQPTNLHTHGLHVPPTGDADNIFVTIPPGEQRRYRYDIPINHRSGLFWYHPHVHGTVAAQVAAGLVGAIIVEDDVDTVPELVAATERLWILTDPPLGQAADALQVGPMDQMLGRVGPTVLVNGLPQPVLDSPAGQLEQWRLVNASATRFYRLAIEGHPMHLIGSDGGRLEEPHQVDEVLLTPGERAEVLLTPSTAGRYMIRALAHDRGELGMGRMMGGSGTSTDDAVLATMNVTGNAPDASLPEHLADPTSLLLPAEATTDRSLSLGMGMGAMMGSDSMMSFTIDGRTFDRDRDDIVTTIDAVEDWLVRNDTAMDHPFHLHTWPFQVLGDDGPTGWKDTVNIPANSQVRLRIPITGHTGRTVYHCHILDHEDLGMMGVINVT